MSAMFLYVYMLANTHTARNEALEVFQGSWEAVDEEVTFPFSEKGVQVVSEKLEVDFIGYYGMKVVVICN